MHERNSEHWEVPYLPIDPSDLGREYEPIVRINSQSGKGGVAFVMDTYFGFKLPKSMHKEFADVIQKISEKQGEVAPDQIMSEFKAHYIDRKEPYHFRRLKVEDLSEEMSESGFDTKIYLTYTFEGNEKTIEAYGNGPIDAVQRGLQAERMCRSRCWIHRACIADGIQCPGSSVHPFDGREPRNRDPRCRNQFQYHTCFHPRTV